MCPPPLFKEALIFTGLSIGPVIYARYNSESYNKNTAIMSIFMIIMYVAMLIYISYEKNIIELTDPISSISMSSLNRQLNAATIAYFSVWGIIIINMLYAWCFTIGALTSK